MAAAALRCHCDHCRHYGLCGGCHAECSRAFCSRPCPPPWEPYRPGDWCGGGFLCARHPRAADWIWDAGGTLEFAAPFRKWPPVPQNWPPVIPEIDGGRVAFYLAGADPPACAVGPVHAHVLAKGGAVAPAWRGRTTREKLGLQEGARVVLHLFGPDETLEALWRNRHASRAWEEIAALGFDLILGPNFSVYGEHPRFAHLLSMRRSFAAAARLAELGAPAAPHVYWRTPQDLARWESAIEAYEIPTVAVNAQTFRTRGDWAFLLAGLERLGRRLGDRVLFFVCGPSRPDRVAAVRKALPRAIFVSRAVWLRARRGRTLAGEKAGAPSPGLFRRNLEEFLAWLQKPLDM